jgi:type VI secretion system secreted protein Hcp
MAIDMFLKITDVNGESQDDKHKDEIDVLAWSWGMSQSGTMHMGAGGGSGKVNVQDLSITKWVDKSTPTLMKLCCKGQHVGEVILVVRKAGGTAVEYIKITLKEALISSISTGGSGGEERLTENITLNFSEFKYEYTTQDQKGGAGATVPVSWDIASNKEL